ncbi:unnamed protein product (macronuclear) [Paramecium tetraurelia]|uniref:Transmembrane protein n=1 Tax=Paramecium tetraurelia TaxID=5888 RepID=A0DVE8_PARTE|nr:uncharacterized protein GSPATT00020679001 [Paramecium tetraurelia]CAK87015.1 unnamed protein product [Paramecium tetraurelia]|eukprot:XP_001454412.1 hypothetical protein (macronuclear) [Paramecium tetraurelia strain d4-2]
MYSYEAYKPSNFNDQKVIDINDKQQLELEQQKSINTTEEKADFESSVFSGLVVQNLFVLMMICLGLYTNMQFWLVYQIHDVNEFCYCGFVNEYQCQDECIYSGEESNQPNPRGLFYVSVIIGFIIQTWLYIGFAQIKKQHFLLTHLQLAMVCLFYSFTLTTICILIAYRWGVQLIFLAWIIDFTFIFSTAFYTTRTKTLINYKVGSIFIFIPTLLMLIIYIFIYPHSVIYICLDCLFAALHGYFIISQIIKLRGKEELKSSIFEIMITSNILFASINQCFISLIEQCQGLMKKQS